MSSVPLIASPRVQLARIASALGALAAILALFPPQQYPYYPQCPIHQWLGLNCPGCGVTRAMVDLMGGHIRQAAQHNVLAIAMAPFALGFAILQTYSVLRWNRWHPVRIGRVWIGAACTVVLTFGVTRNLDLPSPSRGSIKPSLLRSFPCGAESRRSPRSRGCD